jgi:hypothetical protein
MNASQGMLSAFAPAGVYMIIITGTIARGSDARDCDKSKKIWISFPVRAPQIAAGASAGG